MVEENPQAPVLGEGKAVVSRSCLWCQQKFTIREKKQITQHLHQFKFTVKKPSQKAWNLELFFVERHVT